MDFNSMIAQFKQTAEAAVVKSNSADVNKLSKKHAHYESSMTNNNDANDDMKRKKRTFRKISGMPLVRHVYVVCPGGTQTGGPEALHQLCDMINSIREYKDECAEHQHSPLQAKSISVRCFMLYMQEQRGHGDSKKLCHVHDKMPATYHAYNCPSATHIPYNDTDLVVWPECWTNYIDDFEGPQPAIWWLSVDNNRGIFQDFSQRIDVRHFCQSTYSRNYLLRNGVSDNQMMTLTEYISLTRFPKEEVLHLTSTLREVDVVYNPIKGMHYTDEVIARAVAAKGRNFIIKPIGGGPKSKRMTPKEVTSLLLRSKVYIDFGPHPGMDRLPREAALCGCIIITNRTGAAAFDEDIPIPGRYRISGGDSEKTKFDVDKVFDLLQGAINDYDTLCHNFDTYRSWIGGQKMSMLKCVSRILDVISSS